MKRVIVYILIVAVAVVNITCSPKLQSPHLTADNAWRYAGTFSQDSIRFEHRWWEIFADTTLSRIVEIAIVNNRDLKKALCAVESARSYIKSARAEFLPSIYLEGEVEAYRINGSTTKEYILAPTLSWELSLFGEMRSSRKSASASYLSEEWGYRAAILSLSAEVATTLFTLREYQRQEAIALRSYELRHQATALIDSMHRYGMSDGVALEQARSMVYTAQGEMSKYRRAVVQSTLALNLLLGLSPEEAERITHSEFFTEQDSITMPQFPIGLPSEVLERRADVKQSLYAMHSAAAKVGVARAERFPSISLSAQGGFLSYTLKDLSSAKPLGWSLSASIMEPIFQFGLLKQREKIANQEYLSTMYAYEQTTLQALSEVEQALIDIETYATQITLAGDILRANSKIEQSTAALYRSGMGDYLSVIDAQRELFASQIDYESSQTQQYINYITLVKALGGGW